jgi:hypothetical protein
LIEATFSHDAPILQPPHRRVAVRVLDAKPTL